MRIKTKIKILQVSKELVSASVKETTIRRILTVVEIPENNPYGKQYDNQISFDIEVHNINIKRFNIHENTITGEMADVELIAYPYKKDNNSPVQFKLLVNNFEINTFFE